MKLTSTQENAVSRILDKYNDGTDIIEFKSPTGSGKTFMAANIIDRIINDNEQKEKLIFVIATLSSSELPKQFERKLLEYQKYLKSNFNVEFQESPSSGKIKVKDFMPQIIAERNKVIIFGKSSFGSKRIFTEYGIFDMFLDQIKNEGYKLIYIRDEAHIGATKESLNKNDGKMEARISKAASFILRMTATPNGEYEQIVIKESDLNIPDEGKYLLKSTPIFNEGISAYDSSRDMDDSDILDIAIKQFKKVKKDYLKENINPAMLIQIKSLSDKNDINKQNELLSKITSKLEKEGMNWVKYLGDDKSSSTLEDVDLPNISRKDSATDVIIFKIGPATGWDIPRACMLVQLRDVQSEKLSQQTLGRIKRNPIRNLEFREFADKYYVYSNYQEPTREMFLYTLKKENEDKKIPVIIAKEDGDISSISISNLHKEVSNWFKKNKGKITDEINNIFHGEAKERIPFKRTRYIDGHKNAKFKGENFVYNSLELNIELNKVIEEHRKPFHLMENVFITEYENIKNFDSKINKSQYYFVLMTKFWSELEELYIEEYANKNIYKYEIVEDRSFKKQYMIWGNNGKKDEKSDLVNFESVKDEYAYTNSDNTQKYEQALDSNPEKIFMQLAINFLEDEKGKVDIWAKNPSLGNDIYLEYKNKYGQKSKAFIDFVFKFNNGKYLYIEVKGHKDYDPDKTLKIVEAFDEYKKAITNNAINNMHFAVVVIDTDAYKESTPKQQTNYKFRYIDSIIEWKNTNKEQWIDFKEVVKNIINE